MKKTLSIILITVMLVASLSACTSTKEDDTFYGTQSFFAPIESQTPTINNYNSSANANTTDAVKFEVACNLIINGNIEEAYATLKELTNYAPAQEKLKNFFYAPMTISEGDLTFTGGTSSISFTNKKYTYDRNGNVLLITDENGITSSFTYDAYGNILTGDNGNIIYSYQNGKLHSVTQGNYTKVYSYNARGDVEKINDVMYTYTYHPNGAIKTKSYISDSAPTELQYDSNGYLTKILIADTDESTWEFTVAYTNSLMTSVTLQIQNGAELYIAKYTYTYDITGKLIEFRLTEGAEITALYSFSDHILCYSENPSTHERISSLMRTNADSILYFFE